MDKYYYKRFWILCRYFCNFMHSAYVGLTLVRRWIRGFKSIDTLLPDDDDGEKAIK